MHSTSPHSVVDEDGSTERPLFHFISVQKPNAARDPESRRLARSHAVRHGIRNKRDLQQASSTNFRSVFPLTKTRSPEVTTSSPIVPDPFDMLAVDPSRLKSLLSNQAAQQAAEPVFSVKDEVVFQTFESVFRTDLDDPALSNAVMLTFAFAVADGNVNQECLGYLNLATKSIRERMDSPEKAASVTVIGAILLLAGVEARLGMQSQVQLHMEAIWQLLSVCTLNNVYLNDGIKRAIFWQDLNCSIMAGSTRMFDHTTFAELHWRTDPFSPNLYVLSPGFQMKSYLLSEELVETLEDLHALQYIRDTPDFVCKDTTRMIYVDNCQASVQSRLMGLSNLSPFMECCRLAAYISACQLCRKVWRASAMPQYMSIKLLHKIQQVDKSGGWDDHPDLLLWLVYMGGAFLPNGSTRTTFVILLKQKDLFGDFYNSWEEVRQILKQFVWSESAYAPKLKAFWEESFIQSLSTSK